MPAPTMSIEVVNNETCNGLLFTDETTYSAGTVLSSTVTTATVKLEYSTLGTYINYIFTVNNNVITAAVLGVATENPAESTVITGELASTVFPLTDFDLSADYGVTIPDVEDGVYNTTYTIEGSSGTPPASYEYDTVEQAIVTCETDCCISKLFVDIDPEGCCDDKKWLTAMRAASYLSAARFSTQVGYVDNAVAALNVASSICEAGCGCS